MSPTDVAVIGLDPSLTAFGIATVTGTMVIKPKVRGPARLDELAMAVRHAVTRWPPAELVMVESYSHGSRYATHVMGELGGVVRLALWSLSVPYLDVPPKTLKLFATGKGNADKETMRDAARDRLGYSGRDHNEADALWLRAAGAEILGAPLCPIPDDQRAALDLLMRTRPIWRDDPAAAVKP